MPDLSQNSTDHPTELIPRDATGNSAGYTARNLWGIREIPHFNNMLWNDAWCIELGVAEQGSVSLYP